MTMSLAGCLYEQFIAEDAVDNIIASLSNDERERMAIYDGVYLTKEKKKQLVHREVKRIGSTAVAFFDLQKVDDNTLNATVGTRGDDKYRNKGYASMVVKAGMEWFNNHKGDYKKINWWCLKTNPASSALAKKFGFRLDHSSDKEYPEWFHYVYER